MGSVSSDELFRRCVGIAAGRPVDFSLVTDLGECWFMYGSPSYGWRTQVCAFGEYALDLYRRRRVLSFGAAHDAVRAIRSSAPWAEHWRFDRELGLYERMSGSWEDLPPAFLTFFSRRVLFPEEFTQLGFRREYEAQPTHL